VDNDANVMLIMQRQKNIDMINKQESIIISSYSNLNKQNLTLTVSD